MPDRYGSGFRVAADIDFRRRRRRGKFPVGVCGVPHGGFVTGSLGGVGGPQHVCARMTFDQCWSDGVGE